MLHAYPIPDIRNDRSSWDEDEHRHCFLGFIVDNQRYGISEVKVWCGHRWNTHGIAPDEQPGQLTHRCSHCHHKQDYTDNDPHPRGYEYLLVRPDQADMRRLKQVENSNAWPMPSDAWIRKQAHVYAGIATRCGFQTAGPATGSNGRTTLYRLYGSDDTLLYVGISKHALTRIGQHARDKDWYGQVGRMEFEHFNTREEAAAAEVDAIHREAPIHNIAHNVGTGSR